MDYNLLIIVIGALVAGFIFGELLTKFRFYWKTGQFLEDFLDKYK